MSLMAPGYLYLYYLRRDLRLETVMAQLKFAPFSVAVLPFGPSLRLVAVDQLFHATPDSLQ